MSIIDNTYQVIRSLQERREGGVWLVSCLSDSCQWVVKYSRTGENGQIRREYEQLLAHSGDSVVKVDHLVEGGWMQDRQGRRQSIDYFVMEFASRGDLFCLIENQEQNMASSGQALQPFLPLDIVYYLAQRVGGQLAHLHGQGLAHLDIKLENVLLDHNCLPLLTDFECATKETVATRQIGTSFYMAPEVYLSHVYAPYTPLLADSHSFGVMLFALLFGEFPWATPTLSDPKYSLFERDRTSFWLQYEQRIDSAEGRQLLSTIDSLLHPQAEHRITVQEAVQQIPQTDSAQKSLRDILATA